MRIKFLSQGLDVNDPGIVQELKESFRNKKFDSFTCFVAFANTAGLKQIKDDLLQATEHVKKWAVVIGIDFTTSDTMSKTSFGRVPPFVSHKTIHLAPAL